MIVSGTGHRPDKLGGYSEEAFDKLVKLARKELAHHKVTEVISGMALGWDMALAFAAYELNIPYIAAIPFRGQESVWKSDSQKMHRFLKHNAKEVVYVSEGGYEVWKMQKRNEWMVDNCDKVLALWNGTSGGTANCIKYAKSKNKEIINLWSKFK